MRVVFLIVILSCLSASSRSSDLFLLGRDHQMTVDLRKKFHFSPVYQGVLPSCNACSFGAALSYETHVFGRKNFKASPLFIYYNERLESGFPISENSTALITCVNALKKYGACSETLWPYITIKVLDQPPDRCYADGLNHRNFSYTPFYRNISDLTAVLDSGHTFVAGFNLWRSFLTPQVTKTGVIPMPSPQAEDVVSGHSMLFVGYDAASRYFLVLNSLGKQWGQKGFGVIPFDYVSTYTLECFEVKYGQGEM